MILLVNSINEKEAKEKKELKQSKEIICPECKESCKIEFEDYKIALYECPKNHKKNIIYF